MLTRNRTLALLAAGLVTSAGCATLIESTLDAAARRTGDKVGSAIGDRVGDSIVRNYSPMFVSWYTSYLFGIAFGSGGYAVGQNDYTPGQWTRWEVEGDEKGSWMERAYLKEAEEGKQWWRVKFYDGKSGDTAVMEALFDSDMAKILRLRAQFPDDEGPQEMPVDDETYYVPPRKLTKESLDGATVGTESVSVPAGSFSCRHIRFGDMASATWEWWTAGGVPGGVVKYSETSRSQSDAPEGAEGFDPDNYTMVLAKYGTGATSELGSF